MSVKAYRIIKIQTVDVESFNLWHDYNIVNLLERGGWLASLDYDGCGLLDLSIGVLREILELDNLEPDTRVALKEDVKLAEQNNNAYVRYYCY